jgi:ABC-type antimicrobial peptide transport system permease subunit
VVIVNETLAHQYWPGQDPTGKRVQFGRGCDQGQGTEAEIVGVVKDARYASLDQLMRPYVFFPLDQRFAGYLALVIQTEGNPAGWAVVLRKELHSVDSRLHIYEIDALSDQIDKSLWQARWEASLLGGFGMLALAVASVGLYGVIAFTATQRTREFGIRLALGAQRREVLQLVTGDALAMALVGIGLGATISFASTNLLRGFLYGLSPTDAVTFAGAALLWTAVSLVASAVPAYRATQIDPLVALRDE